MTGKIYVYNLEVYALNDFRSIYSFISWNLASKLCNTLEHLGMNLSVGIALDDMVVAKDVYCGLVIQNDSDK